MNRIPTVTLALLFLFAASASARNIDLSTIPDRDSVQLTIYNSEDLTLVRETRRITFKRGINPLQFSWANTLIDPTSVDLRFRSHTGELSLLDTAFPHDKPQMLFWSVESGFDGDALVEITYFTSGITWAADYKCVSNGDETTMGFEGFVRVTNRSGEDYAGAEIRLVVGTINLVQKVAELASRGILSEEDADGYREKKRNFRDLPAAARQEMMDEARKSVGFAAEMAPKEIVKEGLSEYFLFSIPGTETIPNQWSKRIRLFEGKEVPFDIRYRYRPAEYGDRLVRMFLLRNDEASRLGSSPLPNGVVRLYRDNGRDGLTFVVQQVAKYVPVGQEIELNLGTDPEVIHERIALRSFRDNFWFHRSSAGIYFSPKKGHRIEIRDTVAGWDRHESWVDRVRNYRDEAIDVEIRRSFQGDVVFKSELDPELHDFRSPQFTARIEPGVGSDLAYELVFREAYNRKQDRVRLAR